MKQLFTLILGLVIGTSLFAQDAITEAFVRFEITEVTSEDAQTEAMLQMMVGSTMGIYYKEGQQRMDMDMMGGMMKMSTRMNQGEEGNANALYMDMMGRKIKVEMSEEQLEQYQGQAEQDGLIPDINVTDETKEVAGYKCKKVLCTFEGDQGIELTAYVTDQLKSPKPVIQNAGDVDFGGFPLEYTLKTPEMSMTYAAQEVALEVSDDTFIAPEGYESMTFEQFIQTMGAMGGAMGN